MTKKEIEVKISAIQKEIDEIEKKKLPDLRFQLAYFAGRYDQVIENEKSKVEEIKEEIKIEKCEQEVCEHECTGE